MNEFDSVLLVLALIYCTDCLYWTRQETVVFLRWYGAHWRLAWPLRLSRAQHSGFVWNNPLPPLSPLFVSSLWPISLSAHAVVACPAPGHHDQESPWWRWDDLHTVTVAAREVMLNKQPFLKASSAPQAHAIAALLRQVQAASGQERQQVLRAAYTAMLDVTAISARLAAYNRLTRWLRVAENGLFLLLFGSAPVLLRWQSLTMAGWELGLGCATLLVSIWVLYYRAHGALYPQDHSERRTHLASMLLSPPLSMRAHDALARPLLAAWHPLAVAYVLCPPDTFRVLAQRVVRDLWFPLALPQGLAEQPERQATISASQAMWREAIEPYLQRLGLQCTDLLAPPVVTDATCCAYCPRCQGQYTATAETCADCPGVALVPLSKV